MRVGESIYLDYQSSTPTDERVVEAMMPYYRAVFANPHSSNHILGWRSADAVETARAEVASLIGALPEELIFTSGATESNNHAISSVLTANRSSRRKVLVSSIEHKCVKEAAQFFSEQLGYQVVEVPVLSSGRIDIDVYKELLSDDVLLVSIMAVNNEVGTIQDTPELVRLAHEAGALFHCDAAQAPEALDVDVIEWGVDLLSLSAHKVYGPKGVGALFIEASLQGELPAFVHGGGQQGGLRSGTVPTPLCVGFGVAASIVRSEGKANRARLEVLAGYFLDSLKTAGVDFRINGDPKQRHPGNLNLEFPGRDAESLLNSLQPWVCASTGSACNSGFIQSSYVLDALGMPEGSVASSIRFSIGRYTDEQQLSDTVDHLAEVIRAV
ncbi:cysteine desulfurase family protein [Marinobacter zhanjiangensis]|uniref:cysteine desulfurase n=1 Tax=Marinobacter zhanjiangensis TaxID=578215 RepID=A0ABQ3APL7_9GAMM|nr:cysteine desulfurase family protein [Marinobacter zhanjiangensis]GGY63352.1 cysteine desulfurase IscS [Marinobacter zhanjiangensis]